MPVIQYVGPYDVFNVPRWQIPDTPARTPFAVSDEAYADLMTQPANFADVSTIDEEE